MTPKPTRHTPGGTAYLDLRKLASATRRPTDELHQLYALEGFLNRLENSRHAHNLVLKGGVLLAAYQLRRPTRDIDFAAAAADLTDLLEVTNDILATPADDGLDFNIDQTTIETIRDGDVYPGARAKITGSLATAKIRFHIDYNIGDPLWPKPVEVELPRLLGGAPLKLTGYRVELVLAEKIVTAIQRGTANTRWRDFVDIAGLSTHPLDTRSLAESIQAVAKFRHVELQPLTNILDGYAELAQPRWAAWRRKHQLENTPQEFSQLLKQVAAFSDPYLTDNPPT